MKIIILFIFVGFISNQVITDLECLGEKDTSKCSSHEISFKGFSCYKVSYSGSFSMCGVFPDSSDGRKYYYQLHRGIMKESLAGNHGITKTSYSSNDLSAEVEGEQIGITSEKTTEKDVEIASKNNTCFYQMEGRFYDYIEKNPSQIGTYLDITDKNICFNSDGFDDLNGLIDCGYAEITITVGDREATLKTCNFIANDDLPEELERYMKKTLIDTFVNATLWNFIHGFISLTQKNSDSNLRQLSTDYHYLITVESENGKKVKYDSESEEAELIANPNGKNKNKKNDKKRSEQEYIKMRFFMLLMLLFII